jgi:hypothetical protein
VKDSAAQVLAPLVPPEGFNTWLDYAVETFDTRAIETLGLPGDSKPVMPREAVREAARLELQFLRANAAAAGRGTFPSVHLRIATKVRRMLAESGDPALAAGFNIEAWVNRWMREPRPELGNQTPEQAMARPEGWTAVESLLDSTRSGVFA